MRRLVALLAALVTLGAVPAHAEPALQAAIAAVRELRYVDARALLDASLRAGGHDRAELAEIYLLRGEVSAVLDGPDAGERELRRLLVLDPTHGPPSRSTPVFSAPFERARAWVAQNGHLAATVVGREEGDALAVEVRVTADPLAMIAGARVMAREANGAFVALPGRGLRQRLPSRTPYWVEVLDAAGNVLLPLGSALAPFQPDPAPAASPTARSAAPRTRSARWAYGAAGLGVAAVALLGGAIALNVAARSEYDHLGRTCAPGCSDGDLTRLHVEEGLSIGGYALGGMSGVAAGIALLLWALLP